MTQLAIAGGKPEVSRGDYKNWPVITADDRRFVGEVLDTGIVCGATAPQCKGLEDEWARYVGVKHCLTTCSGTAALHMALAAADVGPGDEVITAAVPHLHTCLKKKQEQRQYPRPDQQTMNITVHPMIHP